MSAASSSLLLAAGIKRLLTDLREVLENPVPNVSCLPLEDDLFTWHGNVRSSPDGSLQGAPIHFILSFPPEYPQKHPECRLLQPVPHPNVKPVTGTIQVLHVQPQPHDRPRHPLPRQARWRLALWDCIPGKNSWCSSYSVLSIMLQLQVFLLDEDLHYDHQAITPAAAVAKALALDCPDCCHAGTAASVYPPFASEADLAAAKLSRAKKAVAKPFVPARSRTTALYLKQHQRPLVPKAVAATAAAAAAAADSSKCTSFCTDASSSSGNSSSRCSSPVTSNSSCCSSVAGADGGWSVVKGKSSKVMRAQGANAAAAAAAAAVTDAAAGQVTGDCRFDLLRTAAARKVGNQQQLQVQQQQQPAVQVQPPQVISKAAKKNLARHKKRQQQQQQEQQQESGSNSVAGSAAALLPSSTANSTAKVPAAAAAAQPPRCQVVRDADAWCSVDSKKKAAADVKRQVRKSPLQQQLQQLQQQPMQQLIQHCLAGASFEAQPADQDSTCSGGASSSASWDDNGHMVDTAAAAAAAAAAAGPFGQLPRDALLGVMCLLSPADLASLAQSCKAMAAACSDGALWQSLMARSFPCAKLTASSMADWKLVYQLESAAILDDLRCWYTKAGQTEDVLGLPLSYTVNPATNRVDYIQAHPDLLSVTAFKAGVRQTPQGEKFDALLPLYLTADHFNRALPHMERLLQLLAPEQVPRGGGCPPPSAWLDVLPKMLNTQVVLLADMGLAASQKSLAVNCQLYRLLLAVCEHWCLWPAVSSRLDAFLASPKARVKSATPNLGLLLPLLACSPVRHWGVMSGPLLEEALDRTVLWMCKKEPALVESFQAPIGSPPDMALLRGAWSGAAVACRLLAFQLAFLRLVAAPQGSSMEAVMDSSDACYGMPPAALGAKFANAVKRIQQLSGWQDWWALLGRNVPSAAVMSDLLRGAWRRSLQKGYHRAGMDFSKVQASGVSRILLKGQSYSTPPGIKTIELEVHYKWKPEYFVRYLDGAVMLFGAGREFLEMVAWNHQSSESTCRPGAVTHSGDIMEFDQQAGKNLATICLPGLGPQVVEAYITLSAWADAMLSDIIQPYVQLFDPSTGVELCQCHLDSKELATRRSHKCIIMARIYRESNGGWGVQSVGSFCQGNTGHSNRGGMVAGIQSLGL